ncbi:membrane protein [Salmonella enterica subsp. arizonae]|uniref:Membrane protein n=1 Tax=Salmonella enterica subsp. arizonae TaxID=59203 RepID=A0A379T4U3_SALER|nr:membrane protein [Salmonella enterica subsp. arizonae]
MYLFQRLFINTLAESPECKDYPSVISGYLGKNWGYFIRRALLRDAGYLDVRFIPRRLLTTALLICTLSA